MTEWMTENWKDVAELGLAALGLASIIARLTPTQADNKIVDTIYRLVHTFGLTKPK